jgi:hypothetical protein
VILKIQTAPSVELLGKLRGMYGGNVNSSTWSDKFQFKLRPGGRVAMWLPHLPDGAENLKRPHVSISQQNNDGFHITSGSIPDVDHYYYDRGGRMLYSTQKNRNTDLVIKRGQSSAPKSVKDLSQSVSKFLANRGGR